MTAAADTSVVVAALLSWHADHDRATRWVGEQIAAKRLILPEPVLVESYAVMTRLPSPHRLSPLAARTLLENNFARLRIAGFPANSTWKFIREASAAATAGGAIYDALILECALRARARVLGTFNMRDFVRLARERIEVVEPM